METVASRQDANSPAVRLQPIIASFHREHSFHRAPIIAIDIVCVKRRIAAIALLLVGVAAPLRAADPPLQFNRDIRPILSENCSKCHGPDEKARKGKLRLDTQEGALALRDGKAAIVPGRNKQSELVRRITLKDSDDDHMPPVESGKKLTRQQIEILRRWIDQGAHWQKHWAFEPPTSAPTPKIRNSKLVIRNPIDNFILARLEKEKLSPSPEASRETLIRRVTLDLTGLPPTLAEIDAFLADSSANAYEKVVDRLLSSPRYGERMAIEWLDAARYADTHGFNNDSARTMWRWRDWVIEAFNANMPYDRFITEQLAGDLLPQPTLDQRIATGFSRNHVINSEGGIIDEEYRVEYVADRVRTLSTAWLGLTMECSRCHDHKFDPITQRDYYGLFAFFNSVPEHGEDGRIANAVPMIPAPTREQQTELAMQQEQLRALEVKLNASRAAWRWTPEIKASLPAAVESKTKPMLQISADDAAPKEKEWKFPIKPPALIDGLNGKAWSASGSDATARIEGAKLDFSKGITVEMWIKPDTTNPADVALLSNADYTGSPAQQGYGKGQEIRLINGEIQVRLNDFFPAYAIRVQSEGAAIQPGQWRHLTLVYSGKKKAADVRIFVDGREVATRILYDGGAVASTAPYLLGTDVTKKSLFVGQFDELRVYNSAFSPKAIQDDFAAFALPYAARQMEAGAASEMERAWLRNATLSATDAAWQTTAQERDELWLQHLRLRRSLPTMMVMEELPTPRDAFVLARGHYEARGEKVSASVPEKLLAPWPTNAPRNRLGLAQWLVTPENPLTARVVANRFWAQFFGTGLVKTLEDFGAQGEPPSHPELLDWLAAEFVRSAHSTNAQGKGWDVKKLHKLIVMSATYRQSSKANSKLLARDPENRLLARAPRLRLPAEIVRDNALATAGLLTEKIGGPSVYPFQPKDLYNGLVVGADYPGTKWLQSKGDDLYRRSLYTFWKRTVPHPVMTTFDAPDREFCIVRRSRTNTPLQALILLNEPAFLEAARHLGERMTREGGNTAESRVQFAFRLVTGRAPQPAEMKELIASFAAAQRDFTTDAAAARAFLKLPADAAPSPDQAACAMVASIILNLDETITKE